MTLTVPNMAGVATHSLKPGGAPKQSQRDQSTESVTVTFIVASPHGPVANHDDCCGFPEASSWNGLHINEGFNIM